MQAIPAALSGVPFTPACALANGVTRRMLQGKRFIEVFPGAYRVDATPDSFDLRVRAALLVLPDDAALSHSSNLVWLGYQASTWPIHFSTASRLHAAHPGLTLHRRQGVLRSSLVAGVPILEAVRTFVDVATDITERELLKVGDWLVANRHADLLELRAFALGSHLDGVLHARRIAPLVRERVDSVRESDVRWIIFDAGLPIPEPNAPIRDRHGVQLAKGDLTYHRFKVLVEHDGWQHERDAKQRQRDHLRRERLEAEGWLVIVITAEDFRTERQIAWRVYNALKLRGYEGPRPTFGR